MNDDLFRKQNYILLIRNLLIKAGEEDALIMFEESIQSETVQKTIRVWREKDALIAFAYIDDYANLRFTIAPEHASVVLEDEIVDWGVRSMQIRNLQRQENRTLDASCDSSNLKRIELFMRSGFVKEDLRSLDYSRTLITPLPFYSLPAGFVIRFVKGEEEVEALVDLHRAAFGTQEMTVEQRLAIMRTPQYLPDLDLVVESEDRRLAAFCICEMETRSDGMIVGYPDPIGTYPEYQRRGLASALISVGLQNLKERGAIRAESGTSSKNIGMQHLFEKMGFTCSAEQVWFSKMLDDM
ncbi:MAG: GNAT family N-acetyltransferase [Anaerolineaceae bacterium]